MSSFEASDPGLFRIERKQLLEQRRDEKKKLQVMEERSTNVLVIGTHSSCGLTLDDPITAERHCEIVQRDGRYWINDLANASGTFLNGIQVREMTALEAGDRIALGAAILEVHQDEEEPSALCIHVYEGAFFHTLKKQGEFQSDADEWVRSEVTFGRTPKLKMLNWATCLVALLTAIWLLSGPRGEMALQPGHLLDSHAHLFVDSEDGPMTLPAGYPSLEIMRDLAQREGCDACHDSFGQPSSENCAKCHQEVVRAAVAQEAHPFEGGSSLVCVDCHREHFGGQPVPNTLIPDHFEQSCEECHGRDLADPDSLQLALERAATDHNLVKADDDQVPRRVSPGFEAFSHGAHSAISDCQECHLSSDPQDEQDFVSSSFETCNRCHAAELDPAASLALGEALPPGDKRWQVDWHGAGEGEANCLQCHAAAYEPELRTIERSDPMALIFDVGLRSHGDAFHDAAASEDCSRCHLSGEARPLGRVLTGRLFRHDTHLSAFDSLDEVSLGVLNQQCGECHIQIVASSELVPAPAVFSGPPLNVCARCHQESDGVALIREPGVHVSEAASHSTPDFPHDLHAEVEGGCFACHDMNMLDDPEQGAISVSTPSSRAACAHCHMDRQQDRSLAHANMGGGQCASCHWAQEGAGSSGVLSSVFYGELSQDHRASEFSHKQEGHKDIGCTDCHGSPTEHGEVYSLTERASTCRNCHARSRFHWR
ncbi:MAG TPA: FHA domain-containing protein [Planctomycetes bacterium]|nr:FHA domain-containing protein [Planctomycetota bacterium]HIL38750.1 FHA domain-containing protein [Planctomycetota bacterium]